MKINLPLIVEQRKNKKYSIDKMAEFLGLSNGSMYWKRENGHYEFKSKELPVLSQVLEIPFNSLFLSESYSKTEIKNNKAVI